MASIYYDLLFNIESITQNVIDNNIKNALKTCNPHFDSRGSTCNKCYLTYLKNCRPTFRKKNENQILYQLKKKVLYRSSLNLNVDEAFKIKIS